MRLHLGNNRESITIADPQFGYTVNLHLALETARFGQNVDSWDNGIQYDFRTVDFASLLCEEDTRKLVNFLTNTEARQKPFFMYLDPDCGFYPAGPDKGDFGEFIVTLVKNRHGAMRTSPFKFFDNELLFTIKRPGEPERQIYAAEPRTNEGPFKIGGFDGLRDPEIEPEQQYGIVRSQTLAGNVTTADLGYSADEFITTLTQRGSTGNIGHFLTFIQNTVRRSFFWLQASENYYLFGPDFSNGRFFDAKLLNNVIPITHDGYDQWNIKLRMWFGREMVAW
jgi:hypothetical protein